MSYAETSKNIYTDVLVRNCARLLRIIWLISQFLCVSPPPTPTPPSLLLYIQWVGSSCGLHGPYIFYKAFKFHRDGKARILSLGDFFFVRCKPEDPICIAELQLLWEERTSKQLLSSSKLYFLPEDTPQGRTVAHGEVGRSPSAG